MRDLAKIRAAFDANLRALLASAAVPPVPTWFEPAFPDDPLVGAWIAEPARRSLRLQEADEDEPLIFTYAIGRGGEHKDLDDLFLQIKSSDQRADLVLEIYRLWLHDGLPPERMDRLLTQIEKAYAR